MAALDDLLRLIDLRCTVYHNHQLCGDWEVDEHEPGQTCFHLVSHGQCELDWAGRTWQLTQGDLVLFPQEKPHKMRAVTRSGQPMQTLPMDAPLAQDHTGLLCASVRFAHSASAALLEALPEMALLRHHPGQDAWLKPLMDQILQESQNPAPGQAAVIDQLAELMFMQALRRTQDAALEQTGLLSLHRHPQINRSLEAFHASIETQWTLADLAAAAAMSRSRFARLFRDLSGWTPAQYMTWWRLQLAWHYLSQGEQVLSVAQRIGYRSEAAFSRAFKKAFGQSAGSVRRRESTLRPVQTRAEAAEFRSPP